MTDILSAIDEAGHALLKRCDERDAEGKALVSVGQHTEAFLSLIKWYEVRSKLTPAPQTDAAKPESKFDAIKSDFHGKRRPGNPWGRKGRPVEPPTSGDGTAAETAQVIAFNGAEPAAEAGPGDGMAPASSLEH